MSELEQAIHELTEQTERMLAIERKSYDNLVEALAALQEAELRLDTMLMEARDAG